MRGLLLAVLLISMAATALELVLLEHFEEWTQWVPLALLGLGVIVGGIAGLRPKRSTLIALRVVMLVFVIAGAVGVWLHYRGNLEFELENNPAQRGFELFRNVMMGATPALSPGVMAQLGLLGLLYTYRHPRLAKAGETALHSQENA